MKELNKSKKIVYLAEDIAIFDENMINEYEKTWVADYGAYQAPNYSSSNVREKGRQAARKSSTNSYDSQYQNQSQAQPVSQTMAPTCSPLSMASQPGNKNLPICLGSDN